MADRLLISLAIGGIVLLFGMVLGLIWLLSTIIPWLPLIVVAAGIAATVTFLTDMFWRRR